MNDNWVGSDRGCHARAIGNERQLSLNNENDAKDHRDHANEYEFQDAFGRQIHRKYTNNVKN